MKKLLMTMAIASVAIGSSAQLRPGIPMENLNKDVNPTEDFFEYSCGGWIKNNPLPAAYSRYGSFDRLAEDNEKRINAILKELETGTFPDGSVEQKLSILYRQACNMDARNKAGTAPLIPIIRRLEKAKTLGQLFDIQLQLAAEGNEELWGAYIGADAKNAGHNIVNISQSGLTLGLKDYYVDNDEATVKIREEYKKHIVRMFEMFGFKKKQAQQKMQNIMRVETYLAEHSKSRTELRDPEARYNKMTIKEVNSRYPHLKVEQLLNAEGIDSYYLTEVIIGQPSFMEAADKLMTEITPNELRDIIEWGQICSSTGILGEDVEAAAFDFFGKTMSGRKEMFPLWKRATTQVSNMMGEALGKMYVERHFPASSKERMKSLVSNLQTALAERIKAQTWMSDSTKQNALAKLASFYVKIGYPDKWTDMSKLNITADKSYYENIKECRRFWHIHAIETKAGKPVDRDEWHMTPQTVNAYYNPTTNEICFPAGILQVPFFDPTADDAFNYGAIGVVIGHEMTHGFDDSGSHFDKDGNMKDWWTAADKANFTERADKCADFFSGINVLPDLKANGRLTLGENLADHGGLQVSFTAYRNATADKPLPTADGLTADQRFFLAYAGVWASNITEAEIRNRTKSDPHSLGRWRVNGALPHIDMWYDAFGVKEGDKMFIPKEQRLNLW